MAHTVSSMGQDLRLIEIEAHRGVHDVEAPCTAHPGEVIRERLPLDHMLLKTLGHIRLLYELLEDTDVILISVFSLLPLMLLCI